MLASERDKIKSERIAKLIEKGLVNNEIADGAIMELAEIISAQEEAICELAELVSIIIEGGAE